MRLLILTSLLLTTSLGHSFGPEGNRAIAASAEQRLPESTKAKISQILGGQTLAEAAGWVDGLSTNTAPDAAHFKSVHRDYEKWHRTHIPLDAGAYARDSHFANENDIVHAIDACISVLEGRSSKMTRAEALRWLVHLMGDLHQPVNVGTYYFQLALGHRTLVTGDPIQAMDKEHGNAGELLKVGRRSFAWYWDEFMISYIAKSGKGKTVDQIIGERIERLRNKNTAGDYHDWSVRWASDSILAARKVYAGVGFGEYRKFKNQRTQKVEWHINLQLDPQPLPYEDAHLELAKEQLTKAAYRLSELLKAIQWTETPLPTVATSSVTSAAAEPVFESEDAKRRWAIIHGK